nr:hypothetical protein GCM10020093_048150 [Planobispora longispora]
MIKRLGRLRETVEEALEAAGLDRTFADAMESEEYDEALRASHDDGINRVGQEVGTPVIAVGDVAFFGPVISPAPKGEEAASSGTGSRRSRASTASSSSSAPGPGRRSSTDPRPAVSGRSPVIHPMSAPSRRGHRAACPSVGILRVFKNRRLFIGLWRHRPTLCRSGVIHCGERVIAVRNHSDTLSNP